ncbi:MAG TPA: M20/M25/M40 family metallo-hydrolase, partial [Cyclobacteriaceae bacterium]|nr:M20/M25/M40 family metallo-hydrolase [Cyclobacteriaceae bacterium]
MKRLLGILGLLIVLLIGVLLFNTFLFESKQLKVEAIATSVPSTAAIEHFQKAIGYKTISFGDSIHFDSSAFLGFHRYLQTTYPLVHAKLKRERVLKYSLLYQWEGSNPSLNPIILMAHQDVVPIEEATKTMWSVDPFSGVVKDDFIWGRGTADDKVNLISIMEAAEKLLAENFQPVRTIYFAFGHDEELGG